MYSSRSCFVSQNFKYKRYYTKININYIIQNFTQELTNHWNFNFFLKKSEIVEQFNQVDNRNKVKTPKFTRMLAFERFISSMHSFMNFKIFSSGKVFVAFTTIERLFTSMHSHVIGQLVSGFERLVIPEYFFNIKYVNMIINNP